MDEINEIEQLADEYGFTPATLKKWYGLLKKYPCFHDSDALECLEMICQKRISAELDRQNHQENPNNFPDSGQSLKECIEYTLLYYYREEAVPYITTRELLNYSFQDYEPIPALEGGKKVRY